MSREIRDRDGNVVWRSNGPVAGLVQRKGVTIMIRYNGPMTATGLRAGDRIYEDGKLVYKQEPDPVPDLMKALKASLDAVRARDDEKT